MPPKGEHSDSDTGKMIFISMQAVINLQSSYTFVVSGHVDHQVTQQQPWPSEHPRMLSYLLLSTDISVILNPSQMHKVGGPITISSILAYIKPSKILMPSSPALRRNMETERYSSLVAAIQELLLLGSKWHILKA